VSSVLEVSGLRAELAQLSEQQQRLSEEYAAVAAERDSLLQQVRCSSQLATVALCCSLIGAGKVSAYTRCSTFQCRRASWGVGVACSMPHLQVYACNMRDGLSGACRQQTPLSLSRQPVITNFWLLCAVRCLH
jgi:hypothetical protein